MTTTATLIYTAKALNVQPATLAAAIAAQAVPAPVDVINGLGAFYENDVTAPIAGGAERTITIGLNPGVAPAATALVGPSTNAGPPKFPPADYNSQIHRPKFNMPQAPLQRALKGLIVVGALVTNPGGDQGFPPIVTVSDPHGFGAVAKAIMQVFRVIVINGGTGFTTPPSVSFVGGLSPGGRPAQATATVALGAITGFVITDPGSGYFGQPRVELTGGGGTGAILSATLNVREILVVDGGIGYNRVTPPTISFKTAFQSYFPNPTDQPNAWAFFMKKALEYNLAGPIATNPPVVA